MEGKKAEGFAGEGLILNQGVNQVNQGDGSKLLKKSGFCHSEWSEAE
jgi:hypothetical protein